jgi:hypothetical protein
MALAPVSQQMNPIAPCANLEGIWITGAGYYLAEDIANPGYSDKLKRLLECSLTGA